MEGTSGGQASPQPWRPFWWVPRLSSPLPWSFSPQILERLNKMCGVGEQVRKKQQRLLKNMDAHKVMLDLLQIPYEKVGGQKLAGPEVPRARAGSCSCAGQEGQQPAPALHPLPTPGISLLCSPSG